MTKLTRGALPFRRRHSLLHSFRPSGGRGKGGRAVQPECGAWPLDRSWCFGVVAVSSYPVCLGPRSLPAVDARERNIQSSVERRPTAFVRRAQALLEEHQRQLADSRRQSQQIVADAREAGEQVPPGHRGEGPGGGGRHDASGPAGRSAARSRPPWTRSARSPVERALAAGPADWSSRGWIPRPTEDDRGLS